MNSARYYYYYLLRYYYTSYTCTLLHYLHLHIRTTVTKYAPPTHGPRIPKGTPRGSCAPAATGVTELLDDIRCVVGVCMCVFVCVCVVVMMCVLVFDVVLCVYQRAVRPWEATDCLREIHLETPGAHPLAGIAFGH